MNISSTTRMSYDFQKPTECGERICNVDKAFNVSPGLTWKDDTVRIMRSVAGEVWDGRKDTVKIYG